jgi:undecaprenyl diphosphate synthase
MKNKQISENMPEHIGIIMDGSGRWATKRGLQRKMGHAKGATVLRRISEYCIKLKINTVTFYAFSSENWKRPQEEIDELMRLLDKYLDELLAKLTKYDTSVRFIGDISKLNGKLINKMLEIQEKTSGRTMNLNIAMNYGGRNEIINAVNNAIIKNKTAKITEEMLESELYTHGQKDPDLIIRTANEKRLSNFLLWQSAYSEFWFTDVLWPDFTPKILDEALLDYSARKRRYGGI